MEASSTRFNIPFEKFFQMIWYPLLYSSLLFSTLLFFALPPPSKLHPVTRNFASYLPLIIETALLKILETQAEGGQTLMLFSFVIPAFSFCCYDTCSKRVKT